MDQNAGEPSPPAGAHAFSNLELEAFSEALAEKTIGVVGDFCLDLYLFVDPTRHEVSIETGHPTSPVAAFRASPGGASNVAANLAALGTGTVVAYGVVGTDFHGNELKRWLESAGVSTDRLVPQNENWDTQTYMKVIENRSERDRFDFGIANRLKEASTRAILDGIRADASDLDALVVNQQLTTGVHTADFRRRLTQMMDTEIREAGGGTLVIVDSRDYAGEFGTAFRKLNAREAARLCGVAEYRYGAITLEAAEGYARRLADRFDCHVVVTVGADGCFAAAPGQCLHIPGVHLIDELDTVGAGDAMLAALAAALTAGFTFEEASRIGNLSAAVSVRKLFQTGVTSKEELRKISEDTDYRYNPRLLEPGYSRVYVDRADSEPYIEVLDRRRPQRIRYAVFDHDGTISTVRQGWEPVMLETMVSAILGREYSLDAAGEGGSGLTGSGGAGVGQTGSGTAGGGTAGGGTAGRREAVDSGIYRRVEEACRSFIESTTGVQTLVQMEGLRGLVERFGIAESVRSAAEYKAMYNAALMRFVNGRLDALENGRLSNAELTICGAVDFLRYLAGLGVRLYLASGTDVDDVRREAAALGYADLFGDRIYGATGDIESEPKRLALQAILQDIAARDEGEAAAEGCGAGRANAAGTAAGEIVTFGDGPVEMRETRKRGGFCVGIASDEVRRFGWNEAKRSRLVLAGAHILIPDFGCRDALSAYLFNA